MTSEPDDLCPTCGRPRHELLVDATEPPVGARSSRLGAYIAFALVVLIVVAVALLPRGDDPESVDPPTTTEPFADLDAEVDATEVTAVPTPETDGRRIAFATAAGAVILDPTTLAVTRVDVPLRSPEVSYEPPYVLVGDDQRTLAIHPSFPDEPFVLASNYRLVATGTRDQFVFRATVDGEVFGEVFVGSSADGSFGRRLRIPAGSREVVVPGSGLLVVGPDGATFRVGFAGYERVSDSPVTTATPGHRLEARCDGGLDCVTVLVAAGGGTQTPVPARIADRWMDPSIAPDGEQVVAGGPDGLVVYDTTTWAAVELADGPLVTGPAWADDSSMVAVVDGAPASATLRLLPVDGSAPAAVDLAALGLTTPIESNLVVVG